MSLRARHRFAKVEGVRIHWLERGVSSAAPPVVLLHGLKDCNLTWGPFARDLAADRQVLAPDLPGHGRSDRPDAGYELEWYARLVAKWLEALSLDRVDVVGHSFGGGVAQMLLLECPKRIRRLALISSGGLGVEVTMALRLASIPLVVEALGQPFMGVGTRLAIKATTKASVMPYADALVVMNGQQGSARAFARTVQGIVDWRGQRRGFMQRAHELGRLPPIALYWGAEDTIVPAKHGARLSDALEGVELTLFERCGHFVHHEQPHRLAIALRGFLDAATRPAPRIRRPRERRRVA